MKFKNLLTELLYGGEVYHYTGAQSIAQILKTNKINLSSGLGTTADRLSKKWRFAASFQYGGGDSSDW